jgi:hypothetical protein
MAEKGPDLKGKRPSSPHRIVYKIIVNVKGINVNSHRLRTVLFTLFASYFCPCLLSSSRYKCNLILFSYIHDSLKIKCLCCYTIIYVVFLCFISFVLCLYIYRVYEGTSFITFVQESLYPKGNNASKDKGY